MNDQGRIVSVLRNPIYNVEAYRDECQQIVIADAHRYMRYNNAGIADYIFPFFKNRPGEYYCSELLNHYCLLNSNCAMHLGPLNKRDEDACKPSQGCCVFRRWC